MHPSIYREFTITLAPTVGDLAPDGELYVRLQHATTAEEEVFKLLGGIGTPERWIEEQVMRKFPSSAAAAELRVLYGLTRHRFKKNWQLAFSDRITLGVALHCPSKAGLFWSELIPTLPPVLYTTMSERAVTWLEKLGNEVELRTVIKSVHDAWLSVLREARGIPIKMTGLQRLALDLQGWPTAHMRDMSLLEYSRLKEKAMFATLALDYLTEEDWTVILGSILEPAHQASATPQSV